MHIDGNAHRHDVDEQQLQHARDHREEVGTVLGMVHGAVIEDDPNPRVIDGRKYYQLSFVEDRKQNVHRRASFLVAQQGDDILVEDAETATVQSLAEWRRNIRKVELKSG